MGKIHQLLMKKKKKKNKKKNKGCLISQPLNKIGPLCLPMLAPINICPLKKKWIKVIGLRHDEGDSFLSDEDEDEGEDD